MKRLETRRRGRKKKLKGEEMLSSTITVRVRKEDKESFEAFCRKTGMTVSSSINMFVKATLRMGELPFKVGTMRPSKNEKDER